MSLKEIAVQIASIDHEDGIDFKTETTSETAIRE